MDLQSIHPDWNHIFIIEKEGTKKFEFNLNDKVVNTNDIIQTVNLVCDGIQSVFDVGESIGTLFGVSFIQLKQRYDASLKHKKSHHFSCRFIVLLGEKPPQGKV